jgi:hypothetical protein
MTTANKPPDELVLPCPTCEPQRQSILGLLSSLLAAAQEKVRHLDQLRQRNLNYSFLLFGGLFGVSVTLSESYMQSAVFASLVLLMVLLGLYDRKMHKVSHGWRRTQEWHAHIVNDVIQEPLRDANEAKLPEPTKVRTYYVEGEADAEWWSVIPILYYVLTTAAVILAVLATFGLLLARPHP